MELKVLRTDANEHRTIGVFLLNGTNIAFTLERPSTDPVHPSIPAGRYRVSLYHSPHWEKDYPEGVPLIEGVPGRSFIEIHPANFVEQLEGCIALGEIRSDNGIARSRTVFNPFLARFVAAIHRNEDVWITVVDPKKEETVPDASPAAA